MKNLRIVGFMLFMLFFTGVAFAQASSKAAPGTPDPYIYDPDCPTAKAIEYMEGNKFLPIFFDKKERGYADPDEKKEIINYAKAKLSEHENYLNYYNAAVVYGFPYEWWDHLDGVPREDAEQAEKYARAALKIAEKQGQPAPYMLMVLARAQQDQSVQFFVHGPFVFKEKMAMAKEAIENYREAMRIQPALKEYAERNISYIEGAIEETARREQRRTEEIYKKLHSTNKHSFGKPIFLPLEQKLVPIGEKKVSMREYLLQGAPKQTN